MTTIIALKGKDCVVMAADQQSTGMVKESAMKIKPLVGLAMMGCAGSSDYIELLRDYVVRENHQFEKLGFKPALDKAVDLYSAYVAERIDLLKLGRLPGFNISDYYPEGVFAGVKAKSDEPFEILEINTPHPCHELEPVIGRRIAKGSGGIAATVILKAMENFLGGPPDGGDAVEGLGQYVWSWFSFETLAKLLYLLIEQISRIDPYSKGIQIAKLTTTECTQENPYKLFTNPENREMELLQSALKEIPSNLRFPILKHRKLFEWMAAFE